MYPWWAKTQIQPAFAKVSEDGKIVWVSPM
jgi:hypothetical protein